MKFIPHDYQKFCIDYIKAHPISALFLDMGLGKTVITLTAIRDLMLDDLLVSKTLVIGPLRVARDTWPAEVEKWEHLQDLDVSVRRLFVILSPFGAAHFFRNRPRKPRP